MKVRIELELEVGRCNGSMTVTISDSKTIIATMADLPQGTIEIPLEIDWPDVLHLQVSGKDQDNDTENDEFGNITANKFVRLVGIRINGMDLIERCLYDICTWTTDDHHSSQETFWDSNGTAQIKFVYQDPLRFLIDLDNVLYFR